MIRCFDCENEATHECVFCDSVTCNSCCPHPRWYRRLLWWMWKVWNWRSRRQLHHDIRDVLDGKS